MPALPLEFDPHYAIGDNRGGMSRDLTGWDDLQGDVAQGTGVAALTLNVFRDTPAQLYCLRHDQDDALTFRFQFPHAWVPGTKVRPHLHVLPLADPVAAQNIRFNGQYAWVSGTLVLPANATWTQFVIDVTVNPGDVYHEKFAIVGDITPPAGATESSILVLYVRRNGTNLADTYTTAKDHATAQANVGLLSVDVHYQKSKLGTQTDTPEGD